MITDFGYLPFLVGRDFDRCCCLAHEIQQDQTTSWLHCSICIAMAPSQSLLAGFALQSLLAVFLCCIASREVVLGNTAVLSSSSGPYASTWVGIAKGNTDVSWHHLHVARIESLYTFENVPNQTLIVTRIIRIIAIIITMMIMK